MIDTTIRDYISRALQSFPDIHSIWLLPAPKPDIRLAIVCDRFAGPEYPTVVERLYAVLWAMPRPVPPVVLHVLDHSEWHGWRGEDVRARGELLHTR